MDILNLSKMKNLLKILVAFSLTIMWSCNSNFLDLAPISNVNSKKFYKTHEDVKTALNGVYGVLHFDGLYGYRLTEIPEYRGGNSVLSWMQGDFEGIGIIEFTELTDNVQIERVWQDAYKGIVICNTFLSRMEPIQIEENLKKRYIGEAKFIRALIYFNLVRLFGDIPIVLEEITSIEDAYIYGRENVDKVYEQIISDLEFAASTLPVSYNVSDLGRVTKGAAMALLGKVYLTQHKYDLARTKLKEVIDLNVYSLLSDYSYLWDLNHENSNESIFEVQFKKGGTGTGSKYANLFAPKFSAPYTVSVGQSMGKMSPTDNIISEYEINDKRKQASVATGYFGANNVWTPVNWCIKYRDIPFVENDADNNWPVLRYADVLLMYAEVLNEIGYVPDGEAFYYLNLIRSRAGLPSISATNANPNLSAPNKESFRKKIYHERRIELAFEGHRFFDLVRWGILIQTMSEFYGANIKEHHVLFAIPQREIDLNPDKLYQNPGY
jgi:hypothetical protein